MRKEYDFTHAKKNPYASQLKKQIDHWKIGDTMNSFISKALVVVGIAVASTTTTIYAQSEARFSLKGDPATGSHIPQKMAWDDHLPINKRYDELTPEQKAYVASDYENMGPLDEPPFPANGTASILKALVKGQEKLGVTGDLYLIVDVSAEGEATSVKAIGSPSPEMTQFAASVLLLTKFKPALCGGVPCGQEYLFSMRFALAD